ncbi:MAG: hypothetical protein D3907_02155 [Candidatus Electrothrix sp. AUS3]|nr:hypothetical protein [Candidatus Electrothrix gigas]
MKLIRSTKYYAIFFVILSFSMMLFFAFVLNGTPNAVAKSGSSNGYVRIINKQSRKMLGVKNCSSKNGANVRQWEYTGEECQLWTLQKEHEYVRIINKQSGKMLGVEGCSSKNGANVRQWKHTGEECQLWKIIVD